MLDASVVVKWVLPGEPWEEEALLVLAAVVEGQVEAYAPSLLVTEVYNALLRAALVERQLSSKEVVAALRSLADLPIALQATTWKLAASAAQIAAEAQIDAFDALYVALCQQLNATLLTADRKLAQRAKRLVSAVHLSEVASFLKL